jgi:hypothetical protein
VHALLLLALLGAAPSGAATPEAGDQAVVLVALPVNATRAMTEALHRLRGEAIAVGFEVRIVDATTETPSLAQLEGMSAGLAPAAIVAISHPGADADAQQAFDVWFQDRASGKAQVAHIDAGDVADEPERAEVVSAVRAVDFIRARMFDTLAGRNREPARVPPAPPPSADAGRGVRFELSAGLAVLGNPSGFAPSVAPSLAAGYRPTGWLRLGVAAFGFGTEPERSTEAGRASLGQRFVGASVGLLAPQWHRLRPLLDLGGGWHWVSASGQGEGGYRGLSKDLSSPAFSAQAGLEVALFPHLALELRGGTLWLRERADISVLEGRSLGSLGQPVWFGSLLFGARF